MTRNGKSIEETSGHSEYKLEDGLDASSIEILNAASEYWQSIELATTKNDEELSVDDIQAIGKAVRKYRDDIVQLQ